ncbi:MAG: thioredoxin [Victivallaceae bacterium]|nr:thioredoxin [Victivallaceae bacterium]
MDEDKVFTDEEFDSVVSEGVTLVDFWAPWCGPCKMMLPVVTQIGDELAGQCKVLKVNVDANQALAARYSVRSIPAIFVFKDGEVNTQFNGVQDKSRLIQAIENA